MEAGAASAGGVRGAEASERTGNQNCCEKGLHVSSVRFDTAPRRRTMIQAVRFGNGEYWRPRPECAMNA
jgi:hypothetical protein